MKHIGKMKNNGAKIAIVYRTLPGDPHSALVVGTNNLNDSYHDSLMNLLQDVSAQQANELADILSVRRFPDGGNMLATLHSRGNLKKVATSEVLVTPDTKTTIPLSELNLIIAEQKGVSLEELAISDNKPAKKKSANPANTSEITPAEEIITSTNVVSADSLRLKADELFKQANTLLKQADEIDLPTGNSEKVSTDFE